MRRIILSVLLMLIFLPQILYAETENGMTIEKGQDLGVHWKTVQMFDTYSLTSTSFVYNNAGGTASTDGWIDITPYNDLSLTLQVSTWNSGTITARIERQGGSSTAFSNVYTVDYGTTTTGPVTLHSIGEIIPVSEGCKKIRLGWRVSSATGSATVSADGLFKQKR